MDILKELKDALHGWESGDAQTAPIMMANAIRKVIDCLETQQPVAETLNYGGDFAIVSLERLSSPKEQVLRKMPSHTKLFLHLTTCNHA